MSSATGFWAGFAVLLLVSTSAMAAPPGDQPTSAPASGAAAPIATGQYKCYNALNAVADADGVDTSRFSAQRVADYLWIIDGEHYADASKSPADTGSYHRIGNEIVADDGPWARAEAVVHYMLQGLGGKPTLQIAYKGSNPKRLTCTH